MTNRYHREVCYNTVSNHCEAFFRYSQSSKVFCKASLRCYLGFCSMDFFLSDRRLPLPRVDGGAAQHGLSGIFLQAWTDFASDDSFSVNSCLMPIFWVCCFRYGCLLSSFISNSLHNFRNFLLLRNLCCFGCFGTFFYFSFWAESAVNSTFVAQQC